MNKPITRQKIAPRNQGLRAELKDVKEKLKELEGKVDSSRTCWPTKPARLAGRVSLLKHGCALRASPGRLVVVCIRCRQCPDSSRHRTPSRWAILAEDKTVVLFPARRSSTGTT